MIALANNRIPPLRLKAQSHLKPAKETYLGEGFAGNRHRRVDRVRDDSDQGLGASLGTSCGQIAHNRRVGVEQIVTGHARLAGNSGRNDDDVGVGQSLLQIFRPIVAGDLRVGFNVRQIGGHSGRVDNIVQGQFRHQGALLQQEGQRLANATGSTANGHLDIVLQNRKPGIINLVNRQVT